MKTVSRTEKKALENTTGHEAIALSIDASALVHIMGVLTNLYSKPQLAVLREYVSNAVDSHTKTKVKASVEVTLPTWQNPYLTVRDYGVGMDKEDIINVYSRYGTSTKRDSNDEIGGFGLGAKSALAIADRFDVVSVKDGVRLEFYIEKDAQGAARAYFVTEEETNEPSGVEVKVPYGQHTFKDTDVPEFFVGFPSGTLSIDGVVSDVALDNADKFVPIMGMTNEDEAGWYEANSKKSGHYGYAGESVFAVIGGVKYQIQDSWLSTSAFAFLRYFNRRVFINLPIGSVDLTPSREELNYSERTKAVLDVSFANFTDALDLHFTARLNRAKTHHEAIQSVLEVEEMGWKTEKLTWRGKKVSTSLNTVKDSATVASQVHRGVSKNVATFSTAGFSFPYSSYFRTGETLIVLNDGFLKENTMTVRRNARVIREMTQKTRVLIVQKEDYKNEWFGFARDEKYKTVTQLVEAAKEYARIERKRLKEQGTVVRAPASKKVVAFFMTTNAAGEREIEKVFAKDARLEELNKNKTVYYMKQDRSRSMFPWFSHEPDEIVYTITQRDNTRGMMGFVKEIIGDVPIFLLNSRASLDKFIAEYPSAQEIEPLVKAHAAKLYVPPVHYTLTDVKNKFNSDYTIRGRVDRLNRYYSTLRDQKLLSEIKNEEFLEIGKWDTWGQAKKNDDELSDDEKAVAKAELELQENLAYWSGYIRNQDADLNKVLTERSQRIVELTEKFFLLTAGEYAVEKSAAKLQQVVDYINLVAK